MIVKIIYELDIDVSDLDPKFVDIPGLAKDLAKREMASILADGCIDECDFEYIVAEEKESKNDQS